MRFALKLLEVTLLALSAFGAAGVQGIGVDVGVSVAVGVAVAVAVSFPYRTVRKLTTGAVAASGEPSVLLEALA